jgi:alkylhydroperoxidase/carboxymuconolactone decarboxylase family protein YurZ
MSNVPPFLQALYDNDRELYDQVMQGMELIHAEAGAVPLKYRLLFSMVADGVLFHPHGVTAMAKAARAAGATDAEINEAVRVIYMSGGMVALANSLGAYEKEPAEGTLGEHARES